MKEEKEKQPNIEKEVKVQKKSKVDELKFGFLEVVILVLIAALVTFVVTTTITKGTKKEVVKKYNQDI